MTETDLIERIASTHTRRVLFRGNQVLWYAVGILESVLMLRFVLHLSSASSLSPFVRFIYNFSTPFIAPFRGMYPAMTIEGSVFEWVTLVAMLVYLIATQALLDLLHLFWPVERELTMRSERD